MHLLETLRGLRRTPAFTAVAVASLALGIGANTAIFSFSPMAHLKPGITKQQAQAQLNEVLRQIDSRRSDISLEDGSQGFNTMRSRFGQPVIVLMAVVGMALLVACANLANLLLARAHARAKEFAIRLSLGGSRGQLTRQLRGYIEKSCATPDHEKLRANGGLPRPGAAKNGTWRRTMAPLSHLSGVAGGAWLYTGFTIKLVLWNVFPSEDVIH